MKPDPTISQLRERVRLYMRRWRANNQEHLRRYTREFRKNNPERFSMYRKRYLEKNPDRVLELRKRSYQRRKEEVLSRNREYYRRNRTAIIRQKTEYERLRKQKDPAFKCLKLLRNRIIEVLKYQTTIRSSRIKELIGCDREFLVRWIEAKFTEGMTWQNHGVKGGNLDHMRPCASFDLTDPEQQRACFHYTNLQPLWERDNKIKSAQCHFPLT